MSYWSDMVWGVSLAAMQAEASENQPEPAPSPAALASASPVDAGGGVTDVPSPVASGGRWHWVAVCLAATGLSVGYLQARNSFARDVVLSIAAIAVILMALWPWLVGPPRRAARAFGIIAVTLVLCGSLCALVNKKYVQASIEELPRAEAFRKTLKMTHWPIYGRSDFSRWPHALIVVPAAAVLGYWAVGRGRRLALEVNRPAVALAGLCTASAITMFAFGFSERADRWIEIFNASKQFDRDAGQFTDVTDFLRNYTGRMDDFSWFGQHYPPGNALVLGWLGVAGKYLFMLSAAASPVVVWLANRRLGGSTSAGWWAAALVAVAPVVLMQATISTTVLVIGLSASGLWLVGIGLRHSRAASMSAAMAFGLLLAAWSFFSFGFVIYLLMLLLALALWIVAGYATWPRVLSCATVAGLAMVAAVFVLWLLTGYDTMATFHEATANHFEQIGGRKIPPAEPVGRWLLRSAGNIVAFAFGHIPVVAAGMLALPMARRGGSMIALLMPATIATVLLAGFSGTFTIETDRVWLFLVPPLALAGGEWLARCEHEGDADAPKAVVLFSLCLGVVIELTFWPYL